MSPRIAATIFLAWIAAAPPLHSLQAPASALRAVSWNVHGFGPVAGDDAGRAALARARRDKSVVELCAAALAGVRPDVVVLQEVASEARLRELAATLDMALAYFPGGWKGGGWPEGISGAILSRFPILAAEDRPGLPPYGEQSDIFSRFLGRALLDVQGERVAVYAAHMLPSWDNTTHIRLAEIAAVANAAQEDLDAGASVLVLGDMNHRPETDEHRAWAAAGFRDAFVLSGEGAGLTFPSIGPERRIDYAFAAGPLARRVVSCRVLTGGDFGDDGGFALSDHLPVLATFGAPSRPGVDELPPLAALPDPLRMLDGTPVESAEDWTTRRRPELLELFQHYMYGFAPQAAKVRARVVQSGTSILDGACVLEEVELSFVGLGPDAPTVLLALFLPAHADGPAPVFLGLNKCGNHTVVDSPEVTRREWPWQHSSCSDEANGGRGARDSTWVVKNLVARGYGLATLCVTDVDPDRHDFGNGIHAHYPDLPHPDEARWGTIAAWAWGLRRAIDHLVTVPVVDGERIALIGHSRRGKTALLAAALDERVALVVPHQSGTGGMALSRDNDQETVGRITSAFPHWFGGLFAEFAGREERLPFDQHLLVALVAPRPVLDTGGLQDRWANYDSALRCLRAAAPVWELLGARGLVGDGVLEEGEDITRESAGELLQFRRNTAHVLDAGYWEAILDFADLNLGRPR